MNEMTTATKTLTLRNDFHNTLAVVKLTREEMERIETDAFTGIGPEAKRAMRRINAVRNKLCGIKGCQCGNTWGER